MMNRHSKTLGSWWIAIRPQTLSAALCPVMIGSAMALRNDLFVPLWSIVALFFALLIQIATNLHNDWGDAVRGADTQARIGPTRVTQAGLIPPKTVLGCSLTIFAISIVLGLIGVVRGGWPIVIVIIASVVAAISYTGGPLRLGYLGLGDLLVLIFFGPVAVATTYYIQSLQIDLEVISIGLGPGLLATAILAINNLRDRVTDSQAGKLTLAVRLGDRAVRKEYLIVTIAGIVLPSAILFVNSSNTRWPMLIPMIALIPVLRQNIILRRTGSGKELNVILAKTAQIMLFQGVLILLAVMIAKATSKIG